MEERCPGHRHGKVLSHAGFLSLVGEYSHCDSREIPICAFPEGLWSSTMVFKKVRKSQIVRLHYQVCCW